MRPAPAARPAAPGAGAPPRSGPARSRAAVAAGQDFVGPPLAVLYGTTDGSGVAHGNVLVLFRTRKALPLRGRRVIGGVSVNGEVSQDAGGRRGLISRHCYQEGLMESDRSKVGGRVLVELAAPGGIRVRRTVTVRPLPAARRGVPGCGGRLRRRLNGPPLGG